MRGSLASLLALALALSATPAQAREARPAKKAHAKKVSQTPAQVGHPKAKAPQSRHRSPHRPEAKARKSRPALIHVSYYSRKFEGRPTASGEVYRSDELTAAHRTLPFGTLVRLTEPVTGRAVVVRINDRGPYARHRGLDVSEAAARALGLIAAGHGRLQMRLVKEADLDRDTDTPHTPAPPVSEAASEALAQGIWHGLWAD